MYDDGDLYTNEADFARDEGFYVDDDGHWLPIEDAPWYGDYLEGLGMREEPDDYDAGEYDV